IRSAVLTSSGQRATVALPGADRTLQPRHAQPGYAPWPSAVREERSALIHSRPLPPLPICCPALKVSTKPALVVRMFGDERPRRAGTGGGLGGQRAGLVL